jgi:hypothetical protein
VFSKQHAALLTRLCLAELQTHSTLPSCVTAAAGQPRGQSGQQPTKRCLRCHDERTLFYFPVRKAHPDGWVHCYACQHEQWLEVKPPKRCMPSRPPVCTLVAGYCNLDEVTSLSNIVSQRAACTAVAEPHEPRYHLDAPYNCRCQLACFCHVSCRPKDGEYPPTQEPQECNNCRSRLPARWFYRLPRVPKGRVSVCMACRAHRSRTRSSTKRQSPKEKQCQLCEDILAADQFSRKASNADGLQSYCNECSSLDKLSREQALFHVEVPTKSCASCKDVKPAAAFYRRLQLVDGLSTQCTECSIRGLRLNARGSSSTVQHQAAGTMWQRCSQLPTIHAHDRCVCTRTLAMHARTSVHEHCMLPLLCTCRKVTPRPVRNTFSAGLSGTA